MNFNNIIRQIAKQNRVTPEEVKRDIKEAIRVGMTSPDPIVRAHWKKISPTGKEPTINEVLSYLLLNVVDSQSYIK